MTDYNNRRQQRSAWPNTNNIHKVTEEHFHGISSLYLLVAKGQKTVQVTSSVELHDEMVTLTKNTAVTLLSISKTWIYITRLFSLANIFNCAT